MSAHDHGEYVPGCFRCDLSRYEVEKMREYNFCPNCGDKTQRHSLTIWCNSCGWAKNRHPDPDTGKIIERPGQQ